MVEKKEEELSVQLSSMEDWYRAIIFDEQCVVLGNKNYEAKENELK